MNFEKLPLLIYDSECTMCQRFKHGLERIDVKDIVNYASVHDENIYIAFPELEVDQCQQTVHLITEEKLILKGHEVVEYLIRILPAVKKFSWLLDSDQSKKAIEFFYNKVNEIKHKSKGCSGCKNKRIL